MTQALFRIGGVYRDRDGDVIRLKFVAGDGFTRADFLDDDCWQDHRGKFDLATGECQLSANCTLIPGELHNFNGQWLPVEEKAEQSMAPYFAEALETHAEYGYMPGFTKYAQLCFDRFGVEVTEMALRQFGIENGGVVSEGTANAFILFARRWLDANPAKPDPNAAMIARDGPVAPKATTVALPAAPTAHKAIEGLTRFTPVDHRLGSAYR